MNKSTIKKRNWTFIVYPESAPDDWLEILQDTYLPIAISPLHDKDTNEDGTPKKPHYHICMNYSGPVTFNQVKKITDTLCSPIPKQVESVKGLYQYFTHRNNPEKYQYEEKDITLLNDFTVPVLENLTNTDKIRIKKQLINVIKEQNILRYFMLIDYTIENMGDEFFEIASTNTVFFDKYIYSRMEYRKEQNKKKSKGNDSVNDDVFTEIKLNELREYRNELYEKGQCDTIEYLELIAKIKKLETLQEMERKRH